MDVSFTTSRHASEVKVTGCYFGRRRSLYCETTGCPSDSHYPVIGGKQKSWEVTTWPSEEHSTTLVLTLLVSVLLALPTSSMAQNAKPWTKPGTEVGDEIVGPDGGTYVWVPPGEFMMGSDQERDNAKPVHRKRITQGFWLSKCEVSNEQYARFLNANGKNEDREGHRLYWDNYRDAAIQRKADTYEPKAGREHHPAVDVSWYGAKAYCDFYSLRLPTEAEWEYAARGPRSFTYPWGNEWDESKCVSRAAPGFANVGSFAAGRSWCGARNMAGNASEWCAEVFPRGGSWYHDGAYECRLARRQNYPNPSPSHMFHSLGFRPAVTYDLNVKGHPATAEQPPEGPALGLYLDGEFMGALHSAQGGDQKTVLPSEAEKSPGVSYEPITIQVGMDLSPRFYKWITESFEKGYVSKSGAIVSSNGQQKSIHQFRSAYISKVTVPTLDIGNKESTYLTVTFNPKEVRESKARSLPTDINGAANTAPWRSSEFRFELEDLPTGNVLKIESFTWKQWITGERGTSRQTEQEFSDLKVTIPMMDAKPWVDWFEHYSMDSRGGETNGSIVLAPGYGGETSIDLYNVVIISMDSPKFKRSQDSTEVFTAVLGVGQTRFQAPSKHYGKLQWVVDDKFGTRISSLPVDVRVFQNRKQVFAIESYATDYVNETTLPVGMYDVRLGGGNSMVVSEHKNVQIKKGQTTTLRVSGYGRLNIIVAQSLGGFPRVVIKKDGQEVATAGLGSDGGDTFDLPPGTYDLQFENVYPDRFTQRKGVVIEKGKETTVAIGDYGNLRVVVVDASGNATQYAEVWIWNDPVWMTPEGIDLWAGRSYDVRVRGPYGEHGPTYIWKRGVKIEKEKVTVVKLQLPPTDKDKFVLEVTTKTGRDKDKMANMDSGLKAYITLNDDLSINQELNNPGDDFELGDTNTFLLTFKYPLNKIKHLLLHVEGKDEWLCEEISFRFIKDGKTSRTYPFVINTWFSDEESDKQKLKAVRSKKFVISPQIDDSD